MPPLLSVFQSRRPHFTSPPNPFQTFLSLQQVRSETLYPQAVLALSSTVRFQNEPFCALLSRRRGDAHLCLEAGLCTRANANSRQFQWHGSAYDYANSSRTTISSYICSKPNCYNMTSSSFTDLRRVAIDIVLYITFFRHLLLKVLLPWALGRRVWTLRLGPLQLLSSLLSPALAICGAEED